MRARLPWALLTCVFVLTVASGRPFAVGAACAAPLYAAVWALRRARDERRVRVGAVRGLVEAIRVKDPYTGGHSRRVGETAALIARRAGLRRRVVEQAHNAGALHDLGKIAVPGSVLGKRGALEEDEWAAVRCHPAEGARMLRGLGFLEVGAVCDGVRCHHERLDGCGYPEGLAGEDIPLSARIVAVADAYDSMTSTRSYRGARSPRAAVAELRRCAGTQFDARLVDALDAVLERVPTAPEGLAAGLPAPRTSPLEVVR